jgi:hypothetical protein
MLSQETMALGPEDGSLPPGREASPWDLVGVDHGLRTYIIGYARCHLPPCSSDRQDAANQEVQVRALCTARGYTVAPRHESSVDTPDPASRGHPGSGQSVALSWVEIPASPSLLEEGEA